MNITRYSDICKDDTSLRSYQQEAKKKIFNSWDEINNVMFQMPTGTGKTRLFTSIIKDINDYSIKRREAVKILIIAHRTELIEQIHKHLKNYHVAHNVIAGGTEKNYKYPVSVASIQTITNIHNIKQARKLNVQFIIIDEAHHALAASYKKLWDMYPNAKRLGVTATPWRMNHQSFLDLFDKLVLSMPVKEFIKRGYLSPYKYFSLKNDSDIQRTIDDIELDKFGEYKESSMEEKMDIGSIRAQLLESYQSLAEGRKGIIYAINIVHAKHICKEYAEAGYKTVSIDSKTPVAKRKALVEQFQKGLIDIIVNVDIFSEGFDCPDIEFIQLARPTRSLVKYLQQVGRGLRPTANKRHCVILDNVGMYSKFGLPDAHRHWKDHFLGKKVDEEIRNVPSLSLGTGELRSVDLSEGTEDMELIQDVKNELDSIGDAQDKDTSMINGFFPLWGFSLGETTWKQAKDMGYEVEKNEDSLGRYTYVNGIAFWDYNGDGIFTSLYWTRDDSDFPSTWKEKGFSWDNSFDQWMLVFKNLGCKITIIKQPVRKENSEGNSLYAEFEALSPDGKMLFDMDFDYGKSGYFTSSPKTLYSIYVYYQGLAIESKADGCEEKKDVRVIRNSSSAVSGLFPLFGVTLGKTTSKQAKELGGEDKVDDDTGEIYCDIENIHFSYNGDILTDIDFWGKNDRDFPDLWKSKGFYWENSYDAWIETFRRIGYRLDIDEKPDLEMYEGRIYLRGSFIARSPDSTISFHMNFRDGEKGYYTSSPSTLGSISVYYHESPVVSIEYDSEEEEENMGDNTFDPMPLLETNNYQDDNFIFWFKETRKIYEAYIQDDTYFIISELIIDSRNHCIHRNRVGKIRKESWMFRQMCMESVANLKSITHYGEIYTVFHYRILKSDQIIEDRYFDYKGREHDTPVVIEAKYKKAKREKQLHNFIDLPLSKATFTSDLHSKRISINRTIMGKTRLLAVFSSKSNFGKKYQTKNGVLKIGREVIGKASISDLPKSFNIFMSDAKSFYVRSIENNMKYICQYDFKGKLINKEAVDVIEDE